MGRKRFSDMNCGIGQALEAFGDWWTLLIVRDAFFGVRRFGDFERNLGIAKNILSARLQHLVDHEIFEAEEFESTEWVLISDEAPVDEDKRDELIEQFRVTYQPGGEVPLAGEDEDDEDEEDELEPDDLELDRE